MTTPNPQSPNHSTPKGTPMTTETASAPAEAVAIAATILSQPDQMLFFQLARLRSALGIEIKTGMKLSQGSTLKYLQTHAVGGPDEDGFAHPITVKRTKAGAYSDLNALIVRLFGDEYDKPIPAK